MKNSSDLKISYSEAFLVWARIALLSFGGPAAQISVMHRILIEEKKWVSENRFLHALNYCMLLPGPEAQQLAIYVGWLLHGTTGGLTAGLLFVLPGFLSILVLSTIYALYEKIPFVDAAFFGLKAAVLAVVVEAIFRIGKKALKNNRLRALAGIAFISLFFFSVPFPAVVLSAGLFGYLGGKFREDLFCGLGTHKINADNPRISDTPTAPQKPALARSIKVCALWLAVWWIPVLILFFIFGKNHVLVREALFFSKAAVVTFGGAYSVLSYIAHESVHHFQWLRTTEMLTGLGMAETTPGPLIQVVQFVGFMGAFRNPEPFSPLAAAFFGSVVTTWVTYAPCFLWVFLGAPYIEYLRNNKKLNAALSAITAAVVGVILNLAIWFGLHIIFQEVHDFSWGIARFHIPVLASMNLKALLLAAFSAVLLFRFQWGILKVLILSVLGGMLLQAVFP